MNLEYLEVLTAQPARVLLLWGATGSDVEALSSKVAELAEGTVAGEFRLDQLPGLAGIDGCSLVARVAESDRGVERLDEEVPSFVCALSPSGWKRVLDLLEPFWVAKPEGRYHQYLTEVGPIEWIISTDRSW